MLNLNISDESNLKRKLSMRSANHNPLQKITAVKRSRLATIRSCCCFFAVASHTGNVTSNKTYSNSEDEELLYLESEVELINDSF